MNALVEFDEKEFWIELFSIVARRETNEHNASVHRLHLSEVLRLPSQDSNGKAVGDAREHPEPA